MENHTELEEEQLPKDKALVDRIDFKNDKEVKNYNTVTVNIFKRVFSYFFLFVSAIISLGFVGVVMYRLVTIPAVDSCALAPWFGLATFIIGIWTPIAIITAMKLFK